MSMCAINYTKFMEQGTSLPPLFCLYICTIGIPCHQSLLFIPDSNTEDAM